MYLGHRLKGYVKDWFKSRYTNKTKIVQLIITKTLQQQQHGHDHSTPGRKGKKEVRQTMHHSFNSGNISTW